MFRAFILLYLFILLTIYGCSEDNAIYIIENTCEYMTEPLSVETRTPKLSWKISGDSFDKQYSYQILVSDSEISLNSDSANYWDSGEVISDKSQNIIYDGRVLDEGKVYYWKVRVKDCNGILSSWSKIARWRQGYFSQQRKWIAYYDDNSISANSPSLWYRYDFELYDDVKNEIFADISTTGYYELYINGKKVGNDMLSPAVTGKDKRTFYVTYNITDYLNKGKNVIGVWTGRGWGGSGLIPLYFRTVIPQKNKDDVVIETSNDWKVAESNYETIGRWNWGNFGGERVDANVSSSEWCELDFDDSNWGNAEIVNEPSPVIEAQNCELNCVKVINDKPSIKRIGEKFIELDFMQNLSGFVKLNISNLQKNDSIKIYYADRKWKSLSGDETPAGFIKKSGWDKIFPYFEDSCRYQVHNQMDIFIGSGNIIDTFKSKFNYHGFRYVIVEGNCDILNDAVAYSVETDLRKVGEFECSDTLLNQMHIVNDRTMRALNLGGVYVDCPTRERLGYGDGQVSVESSIMNYYMPNFYRKFVKDWILRQDTLTGGMPNVAPNYSGGGGLGWPGIVAAISWRNYIYYDDLDLLEYTYLPMKRYLDYIESQCKDGIYYGSEKKWLSIGDWLAPGRGMDTDKWPDKTWNDFFNNCYRVILWNIQLKAAKVLNKKEDISLCEEKIKYLSKIIHQFYYDKSRGYYVSDEQTYLLMPLVAGIVPKSLEPQIRKKLLDNLKLNYQLGTGMLGTYFLIHYLQENNYNELLYKIVSNNNYPGWGYMLSQGATTWWEQWNGYWSQIHSCFTSLDGWFYQGIAGIRPCENYPGMKHFIIKPSFIKNMNFVKAKTESLYGEIVSSWKREDDNIVLNIVIPSNSSADLLLPSNYYLNCCGSVVNSITLKAGKYKFICKCKS